MILVAYGARALGKMDATRAPSLIANLVGASLILLSLSQTFNLSAFVMEAAWALVAVLGLVRLWIRRQR
jgi:hypothetical protein